MTLTNTATRYGAVTKTFHWLTALLILTLIPLGIIAHDAPYATSEELEWKALLFSIHKTLGVTVFFVALARILWAATQLKPGLINADRKAEAFLAQTIHWLLYSSLLLVPLTGWIHHAATEGFAPIWWPFGQELPFVPTDDPEVAHLFGSLHFTFERVLAFSILLHIVGALKHHFIDGDATLRRMLPGQPSLPVLREQKHGQLPILAALAAYTGALVIGAFLWYLPGLERDGARLAAPLEASASGNWTVQEGELAITVRQMNDDVTGRFADWTADITFDETVAEGDAGDVSVQVAIGSLTLGSLTSQAMGPDFFNVDEYPTAEFTADIIAGADGYTAQGDLTLKGVSAPVTLPFTLEIEEDTARMQGDLVLERLTFNIGQNMADGSSLGLEVSVDVNLTATRGAPEPGA